MAALERLKRRPEFLRVAATRRKYVAPGLILQARRRDVPDSAPGTVGEAVPVDAGQGDAGPTPPRVGFTVSRKVGNAVARNRARRRLRAAADQVMPRHAAGGEDYVLIGRAGTLTRPFADLVADLEAGLKRLGAYRDGAEETKQP
jgi:ribonuclease P protein component